VRIWDIEPGHLCQKHLLGEHRELHGLWNILTLNKRGYRKHPETIRWEGKLAALYARHEALVAEMSRRGYRHNSPLDKSLATGASIQNDFVDTPAAQRMLLRAKGCGCFQNRSKLKKV
jgi:pyrimidine dimer DNA glycosylase